VPRRRAKPSAVHPLRETAAFVLGRACGPRGAKERDLRNQPPSSIPARRLGLGDGIPIEPLRFTVRPGVTHHFGPVRLSAYVRYGLYMDPGASLPGGAKVQYKISRAVRAWLAGNVQHDWLSGSDDLNIFWGSLGARVLS
jgi:hypothetical protein